MEEGRRTAAKKRWEKGEAELRRQHEAERNIRARPYVDIPTYSAVRCRLDSGDRQVERDVFSSPIALVIYPAATSLPMHSEMSAICLLVHPLGWGDLGRHCRRVIYHDAGAAGYVDGRQRFALAA
jgi:hypothetical protein